MFAHQAELLRRTLGGDVVAIEHVGSTAVQGLVAKPIIDVAVLVRPDADIGTAVRSITDVGYEFRGDKGAAVACCSSSNTCHADGWFTSISWLRATTSGSATWRCGTACAPTPRLEGLLGRKRELSRLFPADRGAYTAGKAVVIARLPDE